MIIEVRLDEASTRAAFLQRNTVPRIDEVRSEAVNVAQHSIPQAGESEDLRVFSQQLANLAQNHVAKLSRAVESYAHALQAIENNYVEAQVSAITRALQL